jgi:hypothetical protein
LSFDDKLKVQIVEKIREYLMSMENNSKWKFLLVSK